MKNKLRKLKYKQKVLFSFRKLLFNFMFLIFTPHFLTNLLYKTHTTTYDYKIRFAKISSHNKFKKNSYETNKNINKKTSIKQSKEKPGT